MATFSQGFLSSLGRPAMTQSLFDLGSTIGGLPGQLQQKRKEQEQLNRFNLLSQTSEKGTIAAQEGNLTDLEATISQLREQVKSAETAEEQREINNVLSNLVSKRPSAKKTSIGNNAQRMVAIEQQLKTLPAGDPQRGALQAEFDKLKKNPETLSQYQGRTLNIWNFKKKQEDLEAEQYLDANRARINQAINDGNMDLVNAIIQEEPRFSDETQQYVTTAFRHKEAREVFEERSIERTKEPNTTLYENAVNELPEQFRKSLVPVLEQYKKASEGWDGKQWTTTGSRMAAIRLEKQLKDRIVAAQTAEATAAFNDARSIKNTAEANLVRANLRLEQASVLTTEEERRAVLNAGAFFTGKKRPSTEQLEKQVQKEREKLLTSKRNLALKEVTYYKGLLYGVDDEEVEEEVEDDSPYRIIDGKKLSFSEIQEDVELFGENEVRRLLKERGATEEDIAFYFPYEPTEREKRMEAFGTRDERVSALGRGFVARTDALGTREERMRSLGSRAERMKALGSREERTSSLFN